MGTQHQMPGAGDGKKLGGSLYYPEDKCFNQFHEAPDSASVWLASIYHGY
jgi:hypothetical protein